MEVILARSQIFILTLHPLTVKLGVQVQVPGTYQVTIMYCKTYCTVDAKILALASDSPAGLVGGS